MESPACGAPGSEELDALADGSLHVRYPGIRSRQQAVWWEKAEGEGFEPSIRLTTDNGFRDRRIRPLCHPSDGFVRALCGAEKEGFEPSREVFTPLTP